MAESDKIVTIKAHGNRHFKYRLWTNLTKTESDWGDRKTIFNGFCH